MPRKPRFNLVGIPLHVANWGQSKKLGSEHSFC